MFKKLNSNLLNISLKGLSELKNRIIFLICAIIIFRIGSFIPIPGINIIVLNNFFNQQKGNIIEIFNVFSGGALSRASIFALGIMPYISSSIIMQLLTILNPKIYKIQKSGELGRAKIKQYIKYGMLLLGAIQSIGIITAIQKIPRMNNLIINLNIYFYLISIISLLSGTTFLMWLGEQITKKGLGDGISVIIFIGILSNLPQSCFYIIQKFINNDLNYTTLIFMLILIFFTIYVVVFIETAQRKITVNYPRNYQIKSLRNLQATHLPLKINMSGVMPAIFASSSILFSSALISWISNKIQYKFIILISDYFKPHKPTYIFLYAITIIFFCFFYTSVILNSKETAENLKKSGAFLTGIRPGLQTAKYINKIMNKLTFFGSIYITIICLLPEFIYALIKVPLNFGGTSLLIVIIVIMEFIFQIQTIFISSRYESILKKSNLY